MINYGAKLKYLTLIILEWIILGKQGLEGLRSFKGLIS